MIFKAGYLFVRQEESNNGNGSKDKNFLPHLRSSVRKAVGIVVGDRTAITRGGCRESYLFNRAPGPERRGRKHSEKILKL